MKIRDLLVAGIAGLLVVLGLAGCSSSGGEAVPQPSCLSAQGQAADGGGAAAIDLASYGNPDGMAIVVANTKNSPVPHLSATLESLAAAMFASGYSVRVVSASGTPVLLNVGFKDYYSDDTDDWKTFIANKNLGILRDAIATPPTSAGMSLFNGLSLALDWIHSSSVASPIIALVGSGLDDTGSMDTTKGLLDLDPSDAARMVKDSNPSIDLTGIHVVTTSLGYTAADQKPLDPAQMGLVRDLWGTVLTAFGATVTDDPAPAPTCSVVTDYTVVPTDPPHSEVTCVGTTISYTLPGSLLFLGDRAEFRSDPTDLLTEPIQILRDNPSTRVTLIGSVASSSGSTPEDYATLSTARAQAVADRLIAAGIDASRLTVQGVGNTRPVCDDLDGQGRQIPTCAAQNRRVDLEISGLSSCPQ